MSAMKTSHFLAHDTTPSSDVYYYGIYYIILRYDIPICTAGVYTDDDTHNEDIRRMYRIEKFWIS